MNRSLLRIQNQHAGVVGGVRGGGAGSALFRRVPITLEPDPSRVITRLFIPGGEDRIRTVLDRIAALDEARVRALDEQVLRDFSGRHKDLRGVLEDHFDQVAIHARGRRLSHARRRLIGAYFTCEYSVESVALFNPSMVPHPDQTGVPKGACRFVMSLRACGEGHISSIEFRTGLVDADHRIVFDPVTRFVASGKRAVGSRHEKALFQRKLQEIGALNSISMGILQSLRDQFTLHDLSRALDDHRPVEIDRALFDETARTMLWLVRSNYLIRYPDDSEMSERVIFPISENESRGIEDARFVRFHHDDDGYVFYATYTAYDGVHALPQLIETHDFTEFKIMTLMGKYVQNKGMALFPRKINGRYHVISRLDGERIYLLDSDTLLFWNHCRKVQGPIEPWEFVQIGNCGSPIETDRGWLLLTHGVGPMRRYCLGAMLLDLDDPSRVIARSCEPLVVPDERERDGYVPNVVYSCGGMVHNGVLVLPYAIADTATGVFTIPLDALLDTLTA